MLAVAGCISQLKWLYFKHSTHSLHDIQTFDDASRGPLGAMELLTRLSLKEVLTRRSAGAGWAFWASILTILALPLDPFAQQILSFPLRPVPFQAGRFASVHTAQIYDTGNSSRTTGSWQRDVELGMLNVQGAVMNGLYTLGSPVTFTCTTANCTWPTFYSLGICSSCTNVTHNANATCVPSSSGSGQTCDYTLPSGLETSSSHGMGSGVGDVTLLNATARARMDITDRLVEIGAVRMPNWPLYADGIPGVFDCRLSWCAKRYSNVVVSNGKIATPDIRSWPLELQKDYYIKDRPWLYLFRVSASAEDFDGPNRTFTVST